MLDLVLREGKVITDSAAFDADIGVKDGKIVVISKQITEQADRTIDARGKLVLPGVIDSHTHFYNKLVFMGVTPPDSVETGSKAGACGGVTSYLEFAWQQKGQGLMEAVNKWKEECDANTCIDYGLHLIVTDLNENTVKEIPKVIESHITSFKLYTTYRNILMVDDGTIFKIMQEVGKQGGVVGLHCENNDIIESLVSQYLKEGKTSPEYHAKSRPPFVEAEAVERAIILASYAGCRAYVVHLSSQLGREAVRNAQQRGSSFFSETCPHYLTLTDEVYQRSDAAKYVMSPPIKRPNDRDALWDGLARGDVKVVGSDHICFTAEQRARGKDNFTKIPNGVPGTEAILPLLYSEGVGKGRISLNRLVQVTSTNAAKIFGLFPNKGTIFVGGDADLVVLDPKKRVRLSKDVLHSQIDYSIYEDVTVEGFPVYTVSRGRVIYEEGQFTGQKGAGRFISRGIGAA